MCPDILNFQAERVRGEIDENVLLYAWTNDVGNSALGFCHPGTRDRIILHSPTILCSAAGYACRACDLWRANRLRGTLCILCTLCTLSIRAVLLPASCGTEPPTGRVPFRTMPHDLLMVQRFNSRTVQRVTSNQHLPYSAGCDREGLLVT